MEVYLSATDAQSIVDRFFKSEDPTCVTMQYMQYTGMTTIIIVL